MNGRKEEDSCRCQYNHRCTFWVSSNNNNSYRTEYSFYAPKFIINEIKKHKNEICQKAKKSLFDFDRELQALLIFIIFLDKTQYNPFFNEAEILMNNRDSGDVVYIASALAVHADFIWTNDKDFTAQFLIPIKNTEQFIEENK